MLVEDKVLTRVAPAWEHKGKSSFCLNFDLQQSAAFNNSVQKGWHKLPVEIGPSHIDVKFRKLMLIVGEVAEVSEALREGNPPSSKVPSISSEAEELADIVLRCMDYAHKEGIDLSRAIELKHEFNTTRPHKHGGKTL